MRSQENTCTDAAYVCNMTSMVTATQRCDGGVTQQVVLYGANGKVVGGGSGSSGNAPDHLAPGMRYREVWTGIRAFAPAASVRHSGWCAG